MAVSTPNLGLTKPGEDDFYSVGVQNSNMDILDQAVYDASTSGAAYTAEILTSGWHSGIIQPDGACWFEYEVSNAKITEGDIIFAYPGDDASANIIKTCVRCCIDTAEGLLKLYASSISPADFSILYTVNKGGN